MHRTGRAGPCCRNFSERKNVIGVDMEYSAICSVCTFRSIEFAALFLVSDELLGEKWKPGFKDPHFQKINKRLTQSFVSEDIFAEE